MVSNNRIMESNCPQKYNMEMLDDLMQEGYEDINNQDYRDGIEKWKKHGVL